MVFYIYDTHLIRRLARERREYIYRKSLEGKEKEQYEKKRKIWQALQEGKPVPTELREEELKIRKEMELEGTLAARITDPKIFITTSRDPSSRLTQFSKEVRLIFPNSQRVNRGNHVIKDLVEACRANEVTDIIILHEHRGEPDGLIVSHLPYGPTAYFGIQNCVLRHDIKDGLGTMSEAYPHIIFENFSTPLGNRVKNILRYLFPVPKDDSKRIVTFANQSDFISFRHHIFEKQGKDVQLKEVGPRFELRLYQIKLGTVDISEAENEWVLRPYLTTAKRRDAL